MERSFFKKNDILELMSFTNSPKFRQVEFKADGNSCSFTLPNSMLYFTATYEQIEDICLNSANYRISILQNPHFGTYSNRRNPVTVGCTEGCTKNKP